MIWLFTICAVIYAASFFVVHRNVPQFELRDWWSEMARTGLVIVIGSCLAKMVIFGCLVLIVLVFP